jgi:hypothetical protein
VGQTQCPRDDRAARLRYALEKSVWALQSFNLTSPEVDRYGALVLDDGCAVSSLEYESLLESDWMLLMDFDWEVERLAH